MNNLRERYEKETGKHWRDELNGDCCDRNCAMYLIWLESIAADREKVALELHLEYCDYITNLIKKYGYEAAIQPDFVEWLQHRIAEREGKL